ncbi:MAG: Mbov_0121 family peptidase domain-containing ABC transporter [Metamycoplasmataceae bacterium]
MEMKLQKDSLDCGLVVIQALHNYYYDNWIAINNLKEKVNYGLAGLNILEISNLGNSYGLLLESFEGDFESLANLELLDPIVTIINQDGVNHYVIITKIKNNKIYYHDPVFGKRVLNFSAFSKIFLNILIVVSKTSYQSKKEIETERLFYTDFRTTIFIIILNLIILALTFISTFYFKIILDTIIPGAMFEGLNYITLSFIFISFIKITIVCFKSIIVRKIENKINYSYVNLYFNKLYFCNLSKLEKISKSDHLRRVGTIQNISSFKANYLFTISSEIITFIFSATILIWISPKVFIVVAILSILMIIISFLFQKNISTKNMRIINSNLDFSTKTIDLIYSQLEMKQSYYKNIIQKNIDESLKKSFKTNFRMFNLSTFHKTIMEFIKLLIPFAIVYISTQEIFNTKLSIGDMILFISIFTFFINPLDSFLTLILNIPIVKQDIELLNFVLNFEEEKNIEALENKKIKKLTFENVSFSYELGNKLFNIDKLEINNNTQIVGKNGCGKSTFLKIIATYLFDLGVYKIDDINHNSFNVYSIRNNIYYGSNKTFLPSVSILQYITNNEKSRIERLHKNISNYKLQNIFDDFGIHIEDRIINNGENFSSGQKQFIILLPLLVNEYELILLDESFDNIDERNFEKLKDLLTIIHKDKIFIEISHNNKYLYDNGRIDFEKFNNNK